MNPSTKKVELLWQETLPQESMEMCRDTGEQYKYAVEASIRIEVRYFCVEKLSSWHFFVRVYNKIK